MKIVFNKKWFNPLYFILKEVLADETIRTILVYGGKSSAKTVSIAQVLVKESVIKRASSIAFRKESTSIPTTLKKSFNLVIDKMYLAPAFERQDRRYNCDNGSEIVLKGIDDEEKAKGVESYKYIFLDELNQFLLGEYQQFQLSLRGIPGQKIIGAWNPVDENSWVKTQLVDKYVWVDTDYRLVHPSSFVKKSTCGKVILIRTVYQDNYWIAGHPTDKTIGYRDDNLISEYEAMKSTDYNKYRVNVLGEWGKVTYGGEFLKSWKSEIHTGSHPYDPTQAIYLSFDENVNPYFPCGFFQPGKDGKSPRLIHSIAAKNPNNTIKWMCREITRKLTEWGHKERVYITGDATSQKEDVKLEKGDDLFRLILAELAQWKPVRRTEKANPSVRMSADFFNSILDGNVPGMTFGVDQSNRTAIMDYENTKEDKNGKVDRTLVRDPVTDVTHQPYGHFCDLTRYFLTSVYRLEYEQYQRGGKGSLSNMTGKDSYNRSVRSGY